MRERIKQIIEHEGMTQSQFADFIGVNRPTLSHVIAGRNNPSMEIVMKIHQKFPKINILWLLDGIGSYEGDAVADYPQGSLIEDRNADDVNMVQHQATYADNVGSDAEQVKSRFYQGELFPENPIFLSEGTGGTKKRKEMPLQTPQNAPYMTELQAERSVKFVSKKIVEIKIFYDDGTYETFKQ
ncbi:MAG: helix-turn-helix transcriptional regulator [Bacteroidaceae bacterium]|nr:helix-turn-helix transcriptional regulator [Bacteroidaceae bacterium]